MSENATRKAVINAVKYGVRTRAAWIAYAEENGVTRENLADHARSIADEAFPGDEGVQKIDGVRTDYGNAVQLAGYHLRKSLPKSGDTVEPDYIAKVRKAVESALGHEVSPKKIKKAVEAVLSSK